MPQEVNLAGSFTLPGSSLSVNRMGYGAMQLAGKDGNKLVWGPPRDVDGAIASLREAVASGVNHIDTSDFYGPHVTNQIIRKALFPYPDDLVIVTKVGARRGEDGSWIPALSREELTGAVHDNLRNLGLDVLDVVNLRSMFSVHQPAEGSIEAPLTVLAELQQKGLIRHIGLSNVTPAQIAEARRIVPIVCVQNQYNLAHRADDALIEDLARDGIEADIIVPIFPWRAESITRCRPTETSHGALIFRSILAENSKGCVGEGRPGHTLSPPYPKRECPRGRLQRPLAVACACQSSPSHRKRHLHTLAGSQRSLLRTIALQRENTSEAGMEADGTDLSTDLSKMNFFPA